ncbi:hypothetical protein ACQ4PT_063311 [Festuca glaucescens]
MVVAEKPFPLSFSWDIPTEFTFSAPLLLPGLRSSLPLALARSRLREASHRDRLRPHELTWWTDPPASRAPTSPPSGFGEPLAAEAEEMNGEVECSVCHAKVAVPPSVSEAYHSHRSTVSSRQRALNVLLVSGDCVLAGLQPILVYMCKVDGKFKFSPVSVNFLTEITKVIFAIIMLFFQARRLKVGEKPLLTVSTFVQAARNNVLLAVPAFLYAINNYLKFTMQLYFNPATVKMLGNLKVLIIAVLLKVLLRRRFSTIQWEALALLLIGISVNQLKSLPEGSTALGLPVAAGAYMYTLFFITVPALASVYNEKALKSQFDTSIYLQHLFLYGYGAIFNFLGLVITAIIQGPSSFHILEGHSKATMFLICNNAAQGILSSFFFKYADTILKKYSSTIATIFTGVASAVLFGHTLTINFVLGISIVIISMHQYLSNQIKDQVPSSKIEMSDVEDHRLKESVYVKVDPVASEAKHRHGSDERQPLLPV